METLAERNQHMQSHQVNRRVSLSIILSEHFKAFLVSRPNCHPQQLRSLSLHLIPSQAQYPSSKHRLGAQDLSLIYKEPSTARSLGTTRDSKVEIHQNLGTHDRSQDLLCSLTSTKDQTQVETCTHFLLQVLEKSPNSLATNLGIEVSLQGPHPGLAMVDDLKAPIFLRLNPSYVLFLTEVQPFNQHHIGHFTRLV